MNNVETIFIMCKHMIKLQRVALVRIDVSEEPSASFIRVTRIGELGTSLAVLATDACCQSIFSQRASVASYS
jgi:hypothetical protein